MIEVSHISKDYGGRHAVKDLSFTLDKGTIYGFLGPNGAGKTTTMNIMTGYLAATSGTVTVNGHDILREAEEAKKHIGYLPEIPPVYGDMTVSEYLSFAAELKKVPKDLRRDRIAKTLQMTMLGGYDGRMIRNLSKGYRQRVGLAQALVGNPEIIILDEPTVGLDPQQIIEIRNLIRSLKEEHTVVLSSHILSEVNEVCDEIIIISQGKMVAQGTPQELEEKFSVEEDTAKLMITVDASFRGDLKETAEQALSAAGISVLEVKRAQRTLEDVFLSVTQATPGGMTPHPSATPTPSPQGEGKSPLLEERVSPQGTGEVAMSEALTNEGNVQQETKPQGEGSSDGEGGAAT